MPMPSESGARKRSSRPDKRDRARGFTLLEVLVAFAIAALALSVLSGAIVNGIGNADTAGRYADALARARSHLAGIAWPPTPGDFEGDDGNGFHWHVRVARDQSAMSRRSVTVTLYDVLSAVSWSDGDRKRVVQLDTKRAATGAPRA